MKKVLTMLAAAALVLSLAACGSSGKDSTAETVKDTSAVETTQSAATTAAVTEASATEEDPRMVVIKEEQLLGTWTVSGMEEFERLTFQEGGTGTYVGVGDKDYTFTYELTPVTKQFNNGEEYIDNTLKVVYNTGETEDIVVSFLEGNELAFHNTDGGGYSGVMNYIGAWKKAS